MASIFEIRKSKDDDTILGYRIQSAPDRRKWFVVIEGTNFIASWCQLLAETELKLGWGADPDEQIEVIVEYNEDVERFATDNIDSSTININILHSADGLHEYGFDILVDGKYYSCIEHDPESLQAKRLQALELLNNRGGSQVVERAPLAFGVVNENKYLKNVVSIDVGGQVPWAK